MGYLPGEKGGPGPFRYTMWDELFMSLKDLFKRLFS